MLKQNVTSCKWKDFDFHRVLNIRRKKRQMRNKLKPYQNGFIGYDLSVCYVSWTKRLILKEINRNKASCYDLIIEKIL